MNDFTDDLLDDLESLEQNTEALSSVTTADDNSSESSSSKKTNHSANEIDSASLSLEAAKASQTAATESQKAAESAIKLSNEFKAQIIELTDSNVAWRQASRQSINELNANRSKMTIMMVISILMAFITTGMAGWLFFYMNKAQEKYKGQVLDVIQTESTLFNKKMTLKVDQLSSMIEMLSADVQRLVKTNGLQIEHPQKSTLIVTKPTLSDSKPKLSHQDISPHLETLQTKQSVTPPQAASKLPTPKVMPGVTPQQFSALKQLVDKILVEQQKMQASLMASQAMMKKSILSHLKNSVKNSAANSPKKSTHSTSNEADILKQAKKLDVLNWLVRQQTKSLKKIQATLNKQKVGKNANGSNDALKGIEASLESLKQQMKALSEQQQSITTEVQGLKKQTDILSAKPKPYSYKATHISNP